MLKESSNAIAKESEFKVPSASEVLCSQIVYARSAAANKVGEYMNLKLNGNDVPQIIQRPLWNCFLLISSMLRKDDPVLHEELKNKLTSEMGEELIKAFDILDGYLLKKGLLKIDTMRHFDTKDMSAEDFFNGNS